MLRKLVQYGKGYLKIHVSGYFAERFLNGCSHKKIRLWDLKPVPGGYEMCITINGFRKLKPIIRKTGTKVVIVKRSGLPFLLFKYRKRRLFFYRESPFCPPDLFNVQTHLEYRVFRKSVLYG